MSRIICDTNVWYEIAKGNRPSFLDNGIPIYATHINIEEIAVSHNLIKNFPLLKQTIISIFQHYHLAIIQNPIEYLIKLDNPNYSNNHFYGRYNLILNYTKAIANGHITEQSIIEGKIEDALNSRKQELLDAAEIFMIPMSKVKGHVWSGIKSNQITKEEYWKSDLSGFAEYIAIDLIKNVSPDNYEMSDTFDWGQVPLFIAVLEQLLKELVMTKKQLKANDWFDLFNMVYVRPNDSYWTNEKYWLRLIKDCNMVKYLAT